MPAEFFHQDPEVELAHMRRPWGGLPDCSCKRRALSVEPPVWAGAGWPLSWDEEAVPLRAHRGSPENLSDGLPSRINLASISFLLHSSDVMEVVTSLRVEAKRDGLLVALSSLLKISCF